MFQCISVSVSVSSVFQCFGAPVSASCSRLSAGVSSRHTAGASSGFSARKSNKLGAGVRGVSGSQRFGVCSTSQASQRLSVPASQSMGLRLKGVVDSVLEAHSGLSVGMSVDPVLELAADSVRSVDQ